jgi:hypothetical protein
MTRIIVLLILSVLGLPCAYKYGAIWHSQAYPTPHVQVALSDGRLLTGSLSKTWSDDWRLSLDQGGVLSFTRYDWMKFPPAQSSPSILRNWRTLLPVSVVALFLLVTGLLGFGVDARARSRRSHASELPSE